MKKSIKQENQQTKNKNERKEWSKEHTNNKETSHFPNYLVIGTRK